MGRFGHIFIKQQKLMLSEDFSTFWFMEDIADASLEWRNDYGGWESPQSHNAWSLQIMVICLKSWSTLASILSVVLSRYPMRSSNFSLSRYCLEKASWIWRKWMSFCWLCVEIVATGWTGTGLTGAMGLGTFWGGSQKVVELGGT